MDSTGNRVVIESIPDDGVRRAVTAFLMSVGKHATAEKIDALLSDLPATVAADVPADKGRNLTGHLKRLGAEARLVMPSQSVPQWRPWEWSPPESLNKATQSSRTNAAWPSAPASGFSTQNGHRRSGKLGLTVAVSVVLLLCAAAAFWGYTRIHKPVKHNPAEKAQVDEAIKARYTIIGDEEAWKKTLYTDRDYKAVEEKVSSLLAERNDPAAMHNLTVFYQNLADISRDADIEPMRQVLDEWCSKHPQSHIPWLVTGYFHISYGWHYRGGGYAKDVKESAWKKFAWALEKAEDTLQQSKKLNSDDPNSSCFLITVARARSHPRQVMEQHFQDAISVSPGHFEAHSAKLEYLKAKWQGSNEEMLAFAKECMGSNDPNPFMGLVMIRALLEIHNQKASEARKKNESPENFLGKDDIWPSVEKVFTLFFSKYPDDIRRRYFYAHYAYLANKYDVAYDQFEIIGDSWMNHACWDSLGEFNKARAFVYYKKGENLVWNKKDYAGSVDLFRRAIEYNPTANAYYGLGISYSQLGRANKDATMMRDAENALAKAVELDPNHAQANEQLTKLREILTKSSN